ncbi:MAG TPA: DUF92 domain-containing protein, partial [Pedobacter sp.]|nr:DUF92 domain-containing protein [Pedobacter sp.]
MDAFSPGLYNAVLLLLLMVTMFLCVKSNKLTVAGALAAGLTGLLVFSGAGWRGILMLLTFFIMSVLATAHHRDRKGEAVTG